MKALNKDILIEYLVDGHEKNGHAELFFKSASNTETYFVNNIVLHEVTTSFEDNVKFDKSDILTALRALVSNSEIRLENREIVLEAIEMYSISRDSFSECLKEVINTSFQMRNLDVLKKENASV